MIGLGRFGTSVALTVMERGCDVLGIDRDPDLVQRLANQLTHTVALDSSDESALRAIDIASFPTAIVAIGTNFEANLMTLVALKSQGVRTVICKATSTQQREILLKVGADQVVLPEYEAGQRLAEGLTSPGMLHPLEFGPTHSVAEWLVPEHLVGTRLGEMNLRRGYNISVLAVRRGDAITVMPPADYVLAGEDWLLLLGANVDLARLAGKW